MMPLNKPSSCFYQQKKKKKKKKRGPVSHVEGIFFLIIVKYIISNTICYIMLYMLEWMPNEKYRIETSRTRGLRLTWFNLVNQHPRKNPLRTTYLLCKSVV